MSESSLEHRSSPAHAAFTPALSPAFKAWAFDTDPWLVIADKNGVIRFRSLGILAAAEIERAIQPWLMSDPGSGEPNDPQQTAHAPRGLLIACVVPALLFVALVALALPRLGGRLTPPASPLGAADIAARPVAEDRPAPRVDLPPLVGPGSISLRSPPSSIIVLNIWASWCPPCRDEAPQLEQMWTRYRSRGVQFIGVDHEDTRAGGLSFVREFGITYPIAFDASGTVAARFGAVGIPTTFIIDRDGRIAYRFLGKTTAPLLAATLDRLLGPPG